MFAYVSTDGVVAGGAYDDTMLSLNGCVLAGIIKRLNVDTGVDVFFPCVSDLFSLNHTISILYHLNHVSL